MGGPGTFGQALGITTALTGMSLTGETLWIEDYGIAIPDSHVEVGARIGIDYAGEDAALEYRFVLNRLGIREWFRRFGDLGLDPVG